MFRTIKRAVFLIDHSVDVTRIASDIDAIVLSAADFAINIRSDP